jgi:hypothetical protein
MKRINWIVVFMVGAVLLGGGAAWADGNFYVIAGGGPPVGTKITSVPYTINSPGFYFLTGNLTYNSTTGNAITVKADEVTLNLMGFCLTGPGADNYPIGINMYGRSKVEIRNGTVRDFHMGIRDGDSINANKHRVINIRATNNVNGIALAGNNHLVNNCSSSNNKSFGTGIGIDSGLITDCVANNNGIGISLRGPGSVLGSTACNNNFNLWLGNGVATSILVDGNSAFGQSPNYYQPSGTSGVVITANNSGTP